MEEALADIDDAEVPLAVLPRPRPHGVALVALVVGQEGAGVHRVDLLQRVVPRLEEGVFAAEEAGLGDAIDDLAGMCVCVCVCVTVCVFV